MKIIQAMEWAQHGIRVNSVSPGLVKTAMTYWVPQQPDWEQQLKYYGGMNAQVPIPFDGNLADHVPCLSQAFPG